MHNILTTLFIVLITSINLSLYGMEKVNRDKPAERLTAFLERQEKQREEHKQSKTSTDTAFKTRLHLEHIHTDHKYHSSPELNKSRTGAHPHEYDAIIEKRLNIFKRALEMQLKDAIPLGKVVYVRPHTNDFENVFLLSEELANDIVQLFAGALCTFKETPELIRLNSLKRISSYLIQQPFVYTSLQNPLCIVQGDNYVVPLVRSTKELSQLTMDESIKDVGRYSGEGLRSFFLEQINGILARRIEHFEHMDADKFQNLLTKLTQQKQNNEVAIYNKLRSFSDSPLLKAILNITQIISQEEETIAKKFLKELKARIAQLESKKEAQAKKA